jgi:hypothetical protein
MLASVSGLLLRCFRMNETCMLRTFHVTGVGGDSVATSLVLDPMRTSDLTRHR